MLTGRHKNKKWEKRPQLYKGRLFYLKRSLQIAGIAFVMITALATYLYFEKSDTLFVKNVTVLGQLKHLLADDVIKISGLKNRDKLFDIDLDKTSQNINRHPWIAEVQVRREFPHTVQIHVKERTAQAVLLINSFYLVDSSGRVFKKMEGNDFHDLPVITGFDENFVNRHPNLSKKYLREALDFLASAQGYDFYKKFRISEINFDAVFGFTVYTKTGQFEVYYGRGDINQKQKKLERFVSSDRFEKDKILRLDLNAKDKIVARILWQADTD